MTQGVLFALSEKQTYKQTKTKAKLTKQQEETLPAF